jgi:pilus assembly protein CpaF
MQTRQPSLEGTGEVRLRRLIEEALRMRPSRIIVGEVRQEECLDLLIALNSGVPGMATLHANTAREAVTKMCTLPLLAGENVTSAFVVATVA